MEEKIILVKSKLNELSPITLCDGIYYKRDDLFTPFDDNSLTDKYLKGINGTKLRQALSLLVNNYEHIKKDCNNTIIAHQSSTTQQGVLITSCANVFDVNTLLVTGNFSENTFKNNPLVANAKRIGALFNNECKIAYNSVLDAKVNDLIEEKGYFNFNFAYQCIPDYKSLIEPVAYQCKNIPDDVEQVIVPAGNSIIFSAVTIGCALYKPNVKQVLGIQISGMDRTELCGDIFDVYYSLNSKKLPKSVLLLDKTYPYSTLVNVELQDGTKLDPIYESKAYKYMLTSSEINLNYKTLFWIAGNSFPSRRIYDEII